MSNNKGVKRNSLSAELNDKEMSSTKKGGKEEFESFDDDLDEEELEDEEDLLDEEEEDEEDEVSASEESNPDEPPKEYRSRSFVVSKSDFKGKEEEYPIWKIDGNSLLQKYIPFKDDSGQILYRSTSVYSGWSINHKDNYYHAPTIVKKQDNNDTIVEFQKSLVKV
ncbi:transcription elongation factor SPT5-like [Cimex lectularius]|uniref:Uncharacterized protein n=1 Tax=Cimex lectularius TaxID=79782 RepID=A0A8I6RIX9_CIMLE|nr:transcription elongation factor SPT5-like [Cimex lectularius]